MPVKPTVSINLCCYNSEKYLRETLDSIVNQTYKDWELIIINDGSTDSTESIIKEYIDQGYPIIYCRQENHGLGYSRNEALKHSKGEYIAFIDHDDTWLPDKLDRQISFLNGHTEVDFIYTNYYITKNGKYFLALRGKQPTGYVFESFLCHYRVALLTAMIRRNAFTESNIEFDENLHLTEEFDAFMHLLFKSQAGYLKDPLAIFRVHSQMSSIIRMHDYYDEGLYVLKKFREIDACQVRFKKALKKYEMNLEYLKAKILINHGDSVSGRKQISAYKLLDVRYFLLYLISFMPTYIRNYIQNTVFKTPTSGQIINYEEVKNMAPRINRT